MASQLVYFDSSALLKLVKQEPESAALASYVNTVTPTSSRIARVEVCRVAAQLGEAFLNRAHEVIDRVILLALTTEIEEAAITLGTKTLRSLDAIHLATALSLEKAEAFVAYDRHLSKAAELAGLSVLAPGSTAN